MSLTTCPNCGGAVNQGDRFCESCGQSLISNAPSTPIPQSAEPSPRETPVAAQSSSPARNRGLLFAAGAILVGALIIIWIHPGKSASSPKKQGGAKAGTVTETGTATSAETPTIATPPIGAPTAPPLGAWTTATPVQSTSVARGVQLFIHNFQTPKTIFTPLFGSNMMTMMNSAGQGRLESRTTGILPAMLSKFLLNDFVIECGMQPESIPPGTSYGFIFRAADVSNGAISRYYVVLLAPNENIVSMNCWDRSSWVMRAEQPLPRGTLKIDQMQRLTVSARSREFSVYIDDQPVASFSDGNLADGRLGLCIASTSNRSSTVILDNFAIYMPP